jgi:hypothetical protein
MCLRRCLLCALATKTPRCRSVSSSFGFAPPFSPPQSLAIFLVLGIGADDLFVMVDGWRQTEVDVPRLSGEAPEAWYHRRLAVSYSRTMQAVFNTSFTTAMAFVSTAISPIMPISSFGIYATLCIIANYVFVITLTPPAIILHQKYFGGFVREGCCSGFCYCTRVPGAAQACPCCTVLADEGLEGGTSSESTSEPKKVKTPANTASLSPGERPKTPQASLEVTAETDLLSKVLLSVFEFVPTAAGPFKGVKVGAIGSVVGCAALAVFMGAWASTLALPTEQEQW